MKKRNNSTYFLGRAIAKQFPFERIYVNQEPIPPPKQKDDSIISKKVLVIFAVVAIIKVSILLLWL